AVSSAPAGEPDPLGPRERRAAVDLRPAGEARPDLEAPPLAVGLALDLVAERRPGTDHGHVPADDVPELRQLVDRRPADHPPDARDARVSPVDRAPGALALGVDDHRAELEQLEVHAVLAHARLAEQHRSAVLELRRERGDGQQRARDYESEPREHDVERA